MEDKIDFVLNILERREFSKLIGLEEDLFFEAKRKNPYDLDSPNGRYELAKDVSSFANSEGGIIVLGLITEIVSDKMTEAVKEINFFSQSEFETSKYEGIINEYIFPNISGIQLNWINDLQNPQMGISYIRIPKQNSNQKYFLIKNVIEKDDKIKEIVFGIARRNDSSSQPFTIGQLHNNIQIGVSPNSEKLARIENKIDTIYEFVNKSKPESPTIDIQERINRIIEKEE